jgi:hypothetical protein
VDVQVGEATERFAVERKSRAPYPNEIERLEGVRDRLRTWGRPLLNVPSLTEGQATALVEHGWSWVDEAGNYDLRAPGFVLRNWGHRSADSARGGSRAIPHGSTGLRVVRALINGLVGAEVRTGELAKACNVSAPRTSQVLSQLHTADIAQRRDHRSWEVDRGTLLELFLEDYPGPGGDTSTYYTLDLEGTTRKIERSTGTYVAISADIAADRLVAYRRPTHAIVYYRDGSLAMSNELTRPERPEDGNVIAIRPMDDSFFKSPPGSDRLVDPTQIAWDLQLLGGGDRLQHLERLKAWILSSH